MLTFHQFLLREVSEKVANDVVSWLKNEEQLSFDNIFGNKYRIVVPYVSQKCVI